MTSRAPRRLRIESDVNRLAETTRGVIGEVLEFQGGTDPADDLALLVIRRLPDASA